MEAKNVKVYLVPNNKNEKGGQFYNIYLNRNEQLDLAPFLESVVDIDELEAAVREEDDSFRMSGGLIIKRDETIDSATVYAPEDGGLSLNQEEQSAYQSWLELDQKSNELYAKRKQDLNDFINAQIKLDQELDQIQAEKQAFSRQIYQKLGTENLKDIEKGRGGL